MRVTSFMLAFALASCTDGPGAREAAEAYGLSKVETTGYEAFGCSRNDTVHTGFLATNVRGQRVKGVVCSQTGPFGKASTVRIYGAVPRAQGGR